MEKGTLGHLKDILNTRFCGSELHKKQLVVEFNGNREEIIEAYCDSGYDLTLKTTTVGNLDTIEEGFNVGEMLTVAYLNNLPFNTNISVEIEDGYSYVDVKDIRIGDIGTDELILEVEY